VQPLSRTERRALADTLETTDPEAPTLCEGWTARDLAAHVVVRERRPDSAIGLLVPQLRGYGESVRRAYAAKPYEQLIALIRSGPPPLSPLAIPAIDRLANGVELFVHHEDVRRGAGDTTPRALSDEAEAELWRHLRRAKLLLRRAPCGVVLRRPDGAMITARSDDPVVTVTGRPSELTLFAFGRQAAADVAYDGDPQAIERLRRASFAL